ncbi:MAG: hypothetical protein IKF71_03130 [Bacilli bacterium]|nr:hypothetical protein [Bacilli bacterium]
MDVVIANLFQEQLENLDTDVIKFVRGEYDANEIIGMFQNFYYNHLIIDATALKNHNDYNVFGRLVKGLDPDRIIFLLPEGTVLCTPGFLQQIISFGIYNFTTNVKGVSYLIKHPNNYQDVEKIVHMATMQNTNPPVAQVAANATFSSNQAGGSMTHNEGQKPIIIGVHNITASAGATTLIYMMLKELIQVYGSENVIAIEINKIDFNFFYHDRMISIRQSALQQTLNHYSNMKVILLDLNDYKEAAVCNEIIYLVEPTTLKLNRLVQKNQSIFSSLVDKKVVLNQSILQANDVYDFENEAGVEIFYNIPPLDERKRNSIISDFLSRLGLIDQSNQTSVSKSSKIFGLFRR